ncbi:MAG: cobalt ECF transporter T component CbiQ [Pseudomonadota bacterium]
MIEEGFINGESLIHRLDPRGRILVAAAFSMVVAVSDRLSSLIPALLLSLCLIWIAGLPWKKVLSRLLIVNGMIFLVWVFLPFAMEGAPLFSVGPLVATREGTGYALLITLKSNAIILALMALMATMSVFTLGRAMRHLRVPTKIVQLFFFTYRYIHVIHSETNRMLRTIKSRGFRPGNNLHTYRTYAYLVGMLLIKSQERAERVRAAMLCRGFRGNFYDLSEPAFRISDWLTVGLMLLTVAGIAFLEWGT